MSISKWKRTIQQALDGVAPGWVLVRHARTGHLIWRHPSGGQITTGSTPSDRRRAAENIRRDARSAIRTAEAENPGGSARRS